MAESEKARESSLKISAPYVKSWLVFLAGLAAIVFLFWLCCALVSRFYSGAVFLFAAGIAAGIIWGACDIFFEFLYVIKGRVSVKIANRFECPKLWDAVERASFGLHSRFQKIHVYLIPEKTFDAYIISWGSQCWLSATEGIVDFLDDDELAAVIAHEFGHDFYKTDFIPLAVMIIASRIAAVTGISFILLAFWKFRTEFILVGAAVYFLKYWVAIACAFVSRQHEYFSDAFSAKTLGDSRPMIGALQKLESLSWLPDSNCDRVAEIASSHPSHEKRIKALEKWKNKSEI